MTLRLTLIGLAILAGGCSAGATIVKQDARGGQLALYGPAVPAAQRARVVMLDHCDGRYEASEGEGQLTYRCSANLVIARADR